MNPESDGDRPADEEDIGSPQMVMPVALDRLRWPATILATRLASMEGCDGLEVPPVSEEGVGGPAPHGFDDVRWNAGSKELRRSADTEAMACCTWVSEGRPYLVAPGEKGGFRERTRTGRGGEGE